MKPAPVKPESPALKNSRQALSLMAGLGIDPTPVNYSVWFHYVTGEKKELNRELDDLLLKKTTHITNDVHIYLYNKHVNPVQPIEKATEAAAQHTHVVLAEIMRAIEKFSGDASTYNQQVSEQVAGLEEKIEDPALKDMAKEIISRTMAIRNSGVVLSGKLEESKREVSQLKTHLEQVTTESSRDFLTKTANRKALESKLDELTAWASENKKDLCLLMIDIDHFKSFNDKYGHLFGDEVLRKVSRALFESVKGKDFVARYGGEEFAILLPDTSLSGGLIVAEHIRKSIAETDLVRKDTGESLGGVTISVGVARYRTDSDTPVQFISRADSALYRAKMSGRNCVKQESFEVPKS